MCILLSGVKADGLPKVRAVDDMTASMINESTQQGEKLKCETLDLLFEVSKRLAAKVKVRAFFLVSTVSTKSIVDMHNFNKNTPIAILASSDSVVAHLLVTFSFICIHGYLILYSCFCGCAAGLVCFRFS